MICVAAPQWARVVLQGEYLFITIKKKLNKKIILNINIHLKYCYSTGTCRISVLQDRGWELFCDLK